MTSKQKFYSYSLKDLIMGEEGSSKKKKKKMQDELGTKTNDGHIKQ